MQKIFAMLYKRKKEEEERRNDIRLFRIENEINILTQRLSIIEDDLDRLEKEKDDLEIKVIDNNL